MNKIRALKACQPNIKLLYLFFPVVTKKGRENQLQAHKNRRENVFLLEPWLFQMDLRTDVSYKEFCFNQLVTVNL